MLNSSGVVNDNGNRVKIELIDGPVDNGSRKKVYPRKRIAMAESINIMDIKFANFGRSVSDIFVSSFKFY